MTTLWADLETFSTRDIMNGPHQYAEDCEVLLFGYAIDDGPAKVWDVTTGERMPFELEAVLAAAQMNAPDINIVWHNGANFDVPVLRKAKNLHVDIPFERVDDCMVKAYSHGLPGSLGALSEIYGLGVDKAKDKDGRRLVLKFCKPDSKGNIRNRQTDPEDWARFVNYCRLDVEAMRAIYKKLPSWNWGPRDRAQFVIDQRINNRGVRMDLDLARAAIALADKLRAENAKRTQDLTNGEVAAATQRDALLAHILQQYGVSLPDLTKSTIERRLNDENLPEPVKELLRVRLASTKTSTAKYKKLIASTSADGRMRGCLQFRGATRTGRYAGRLMQLQNLPRPTLPQYVIDAGIEAIKGGWAEYLAEPGELMSSCLRSCIMATPGKHLVVADLSNIEGRMLAWLAGEEWKLKAFRDFDAGHGPDLYKATYGRTFGIRPEDVTKHQRQIGKVMELALGYQGGVGAFLTFASAYSIDLDELAKHVRENISFSYWGQAEGSYEWYKEKKLTHGLKRETFIACEAVKLAWRDAHPAIQKFWADVDKAAVSALKGVPAKAAKIWFSKNGSWLRMKLPSGRFICYPGARLEDGGVGTGTFSYMGINQYSRKWERIRTYSGKCCIARGSLVLTSKGWTPIEKVTPDLLVWDGVDWVSQDGAVYQGRRSVIQCYGAHMTPDHLVLTMRGWRYASSCSRYNRAPCRLPNGYLLPRLERQTLTMESALRLRQGNSHGSLGAEEVGQEGSEGFMRLHEAENSCRKFEKTRHVKAPGLWCMAFHEGALQLPLSSGVQKLWRSGYQSLRALGKIVRRFLVRHGIAVSAGPDFGKDRRKRKLLSGELSLGDAERTGEQHSKDSDCFRQATILLGGKDGDRPNNTSLPTQSRVPGGTSFRQARYTAEVFDLINCGPRHRFVILADGKPLIVHNCENATQAAAADILIGAMDSIEKAGFEIVFSVHDEFITEADLSKDNTELEKLMSTPPSWAPDLPLAAAGFTSLRYRKD